MPSSAPSPQGRAGAALVRELLRAQEEDGCLGPPVPAPGAGAGHSVDPAALAQGGDFCRRTPPRTACPKDVGGEEAPKVPEATLHAGPEPHSGALPPHGASAVVAL